MELKKACDSVRKEVLYNILTEFGIPTKQVRLLTKRLNETYGTVRVSRHLSDMFPIKNVLEKVDTLLPFFFSFAVVYNSRVQKNQMT
jgi:hypothetical protein